MYHIVFIILLLFSIYEFFGKTNKVLTYSLFVFLLLFVSLRYGQGSDYFSYIYTFEFSANAFDSALLYNDFSYVTHEIGFAAFSYLWLIILKLSPESLNALFSVVSFVLAWLFIKKYSQRPIISLFIFYCIFYLVYPFSTIRQAVCIGIFTYYLVPMLNERKYFRYYLITLLLVTIHYSSAIVLFIPVVNLIKKYHLYQVYVISILSLVIGVVLFQYIYSFFSVFDVIGGKVEYYTQTNSLNILSILSRTALFIPILQLSKIYAKGSIQETFLKIYIIGFFLYLIFLGSSLISARLNVYMRYAEVFLLVDFLLYVFKYKLNRIVSFSYIILIMTVFYVKNIDSFIVQGPYYSHINFYNYPYVSIFNKKDILEARDVKPTLIPYINL